MCDTEGCSRFSRCICCIQRGINWLAEELSAKQAQKSHQTILEDSKLPAILLENGHKSSCASSK